MKAHQTKAWNKLSQSERLRLASVCSQQVYELVNKEEVELQKRWIELACVMLHDTFGWDETQLFLFLGNWTNSYQWMRQFKTGEEQEKAVQDRLKEIFPSGFPQEFLDNLERN